MDQRKAGYHSAASQAKMRALDCERRGMPQAAQYWWEKHKKWIQLADKENNNDETELG